MRRSLLTNCSLVNQLQDSDIILVLSLFRLSNGALCVFCMLIFEMQSNARIKGGSGRTALTFLTSSGGGAGGVDLGR